MDDQNQQEQAPPDEERRQEDRRQSYQDPMGDNAAEAALIFLRGTAREAGRKKAKMVYMERYVKIVLARLKYNSTLRSDAAQDTYARAHPEYDEACKEEQAAIEDYEALYWKRIAAEATIEAWRTRNANIRGAHRMT